MIERGKKVKEVLNDLGIKLKSLAPVLNKNEVYIYQLLDKDDLSWEIIRKIGKHINYDFRKTFPDMPFEYEITEDDFSVVEESSTSLEYEVKKWKDKYFALLEDMSELMRQKKSETSFA